MEALQIRPVPEVDRIAPSPELSRSFVHQVRSRLSRIPPVPTTIKAPEEAQPEPLTHTNSLATSTAGKTSESSTADTVATSILLLPSVFFTSKIHVAPTMHIEEELQVIWDQRVRVTLREILLHEITAGSCVQELMMAGKDPFRLKPTIVVTCGNVKTQKLVKKVFRKQSWLKDFLKEKGMRFVAVVQPVHLSSTYANTTIIATTIQSAMNATYGGSITTITSTQPVVTNISTFSTNTNLAAATSSSQPGHGPVRNISLIAGLSVGLGAPALLSVVLCCFCCFRYRRNKRHLGQLPQPEQSMSFREYGDDPGIFPSISRSRWLSTLR